MAEELTLPEQPDGIESESFDLPAPDAAAARVGEYLEWWGDGLIDTLGGPNSRHEATPLYARDLQALVNSARDMSWRMAYLEARDAERGVEVERLRREVEFEANPEEFYADIAFSRDNLRHPLCACITDEQAAALAPGFSRPVCTVHPGGVS
jgi:hypothetical protein